MPKKRFFLCCCRLGDEEEDNQLQYQNIPKPRITASAQPVQQPVELPAEEADDANALEYMNIPSKQSSLPQPVSISDNKRI